MVQLENVPGQSPASCKISQKMLTRKPMQREHSKTGVSIARVHPDSTLFSTFVTRVFESVCLSLLLLLLTAYAWLQFSTATDPDVARAP